MLDFKKTLERRERRRIADIGDDLKRGIKRRLSSNVRDVRLEFARIHELLDAEKTQVAIDRVLRVRRNEFCKAQRRFQKLYPLNEESLHEMRIALKKMRYVVEAAQPVLGTSAKDRAKQMQGFQQLLGDTRDVDMLRTELEKWASKQGKKIAVVPALDRLLEKKEKLLKKIVASSAKFEMLLRPETLRPAAEKTHVIAAKNPTTSGVGGAALASAAN
jgi:CHAD domain-containing protein